MSRNTVTWLLHKPKLTDGGAGLLLRFIESSVMKRFTANEANLRLLKSHRDSQWAHCQALLKRHGISKKRNIIETIEKVDKEKLL